MTVANYRPRLVAALAIAFIAMGCHRPPNISVESADKSDSEGWIAKATFEEIPELKKQAMAGASPAARRLASYYMKFPNDVDTYDYWSRIAAENGSASGQWNYAVMLENEATELSKLRARFWLERAAAQGDRMARDRLAALDKQAAK